jgi:hypothetical protein
MGQYQFIVDFYYIYQSSLTNQKGNIMNRTQQLSIASLVLAGVFVSGCSQQQIQEPTPEPMPTPVVKSTPEPTPAPVVVSKPEPAPVMKPVAVVKPKPINPNCHYHPANSMSKAVKHCHKNPQGKHHYGNAVKQAPIVATPMQEMPVAPVKPRVDVRALQRKLKSKGYYKGPIDGVVGNGTRDALQRFQNR